MNLPDAHRDPSPLGGAAKATKNALARLLPTRTQIPAWAHALTRPAQEKATRTGPLIAYESLGAPVWSGRDYAAFSREGFMQNAIVYRCVRMISEAAASIPLLLYDGVNELEDHPLLSLLASPSPHQTGTDFLESFIGYLLVSGNSYVEAVALNGTLRELYALRPDRMSVLPGLSGWPEGYEYTAAGGSVRFSADVVPGVRPILHMRLFHPLDDHYGMSPIEAAAVAIDIHNQASKWNKALLDNAARPSGALVYAAREGRLSPEQFDRLKNELQEGFQGAKNAGRPLLLEGGLDWKPLSLTPAELDFVNSKHAAAREIALALGVPPMLLGIPGDNTFSNYQEANRTFWRNTVIPLATRSATAISNWLGAAYGGGLSLKPDLDQVEALAPEREALWTRLEKTSFLTPNEKRGAAGYGPVDGGNQLKFSPPIRPKYSPDQPRDDQGQWTNGDGGISLVADRSYNPVDILEEDGLGGHTYQRHVGKSDEFLLNRVQTETFWLGNIEFPLKRAGTYPSVQAANKLTNSALSNPDNQINVENVASGRAGRAFVTSTFASPTGVEAYAARPHAQPYMRDTYSVGVGIVHDPARPRGYRVITSYPMNLD